jgi:hypothetical protein
MAYIGSTPTSQNFIAGTDYFNGTGSQTAFTLTRTVNSVNDIEVVINNVVQQPSTAYTLSGTTITFTSAPSSGTNNIYVRYLATNMQSFTVPANSITRNQLDSNLQAGFQGRNKIINGHMVIDQRNAGASVTVNSTSQFFSVDRWVGRGDTEGVFTLQQSTTAPAGFNYALKATVTTADASIGSTQRYEIYQRIEGYNVADLNWGTANAKTITVSFWARSSLTGTFGGSVSNGNNDRSYPFTYTINAADTYEYKTITIVGETTGSWESTNGMGIWLNFALGEGSSRLGTAGAWGNALYLGATGQNQVISTVGATLYITGVQLEEGTTATSFEREIYSVTLQKCQRYCWVGGADGDGYGYVYCDSSARNNSLTAAFGSFPVIMRTSPTFSATTTPTYTGCTAQDFTANTSGFQVRVGISSATSFRAGGGIYLSTAEL